MSTKFLKHFNTRQTPQSEPIPGSAQVPNSAGGYAFAVDDWARLERFLILGSEGGSYYATERALTVENAKAVVRCLEADAARAIRTIVQVSDSGRAPKNEPAVLALAIAAGMGHTAAALRGAAEGLPDRHAPVRLRRGRAGPARLGPRAARGHRRLVRGRRRRRPWPTRSPSTSGASGWSHRDLLRLAHPATADPARQAVYRWVVGGAEALGAARGQAGRGGRARTPRSPRTCRACSPRWTRPEDGRPRRPSHPADPRGRPAARVHPDGAPERPGGLGGAARGHAADGDGAQPRQDDGRRPARRPARRRRRRSASGWRTASTSASRGCTRWRSCSPRPRTPAAAG